MEDEPEEGAGGDDLGVGDDKSWRGRAKASGLHPVDFAEKELEKAETTYDRLLYEEGTLSAGMRDLKDYKFESAIRKIKRFASKHEVSDDPRSLQEQQSQMLKLMAPIRDLPMIARCLEYQPGGEEDEENEDGEWLRGLKEVMETMSNAEPSTVSHNAITGVHLNHSLAIVCHVSGHRWQRRSPTWKP